MLREAPHASLRQKLLHLLPVYFWRDGEEWPGPAKIINITKHEVVVMHNSQLKFTPFNKVTQLFPQLVRLYDADEEVPPPIPWASSPDARLISTDRRRDDNDDRHQSKSSATGTKLRRNLKALQEDTERV